MVFTELLLLYENGYSFTVCNEIWYLLAVLPIFFSLHFLKYMKAFIGSVVHVAFFWPVSFILMSQAKRYYKNGNWVERAGGQRPLGVIKPVAKSQGTSLMCAACLLPDELLHRPNTSVSRGPQKPCRVPAERFYMVERLWSNAAQAKQKVPFFHFVLSRSDCAPPSTHIIYTRYLISWPAATQHMSHSRRVCPPAADFDLRQKENGLDC